METDLPDARRLHTYGLTYGDENTYRLRRAQRLLGLSHGQMADRLNTSVGTYEGWIRGRYRTPGVAVVAAELLCKASRTNGQFAIWIRGSRRLEVQ